MAFLALWSIVSLVVIVVWATSPDLKGSAQCRAELRDATEKLEGAKVVWNKKKEELVELVEAGRQEREHQRAEILLLLGRLNATNATLEACRRETVSDACSNPVTVPDIPELLRTAPPRYPGVLPLSSELKETMCS